MDPRLSTRLRESFIQERAPAWTSSAACAERTTADWFSDDVADPGLKREPTFPDSVYVALETCYSCPVQRECLEMAYNATVPRSWGWANVYTSHTKKCDDDLYESKVVAVREAAARCGGCIPEDERITYSEVKWKPMHAGIFGVPALIRERMDGPNRIEACLAWLAKVAIERHFGTPTAQREEQVV